MKTLCIYKDYTGFTLVEIMIALFILAVGILGVTGMFTASMKANQLGRTTTVGTRLAQNIMEQVKTNSSNVFLNFTSGTGIHYAATAVTSGNRTKRGGKFREASSGNLNMINYSAILQKDAYKPYSGLDTFTVSVKWRDRYGSHQTTLITYMEQ